VKDEFTAREIAKTLGIHKTSVIRRAEAENWPYNNGGNRAKHYLLAGMPADVQAAVNLTDNQSQVARGTSKGEMRLSLYNKDRANSDGSVGSGVSDTKSMPAPRCVGDPGLTEWQNRIALARADLIAAYLKEKAKGKKNREATKAGRLFIKGYSTGSLMPAVFGVLGSVAVPTIETWVKAFHEANCDYAALAPEWGNRRGQRKVTDEEFNTLLSFALHPNRLCVSEVIRLTKIALERRCISSPSSNDTLRRSLLDWKSHNYDKWVFCREGEKALNDKCLPYIERDAGLLDVGEVLVADGHTLNFQILHPFTGKPARMTMITWYDWASCYPAGWEIMATENIQCVAAGLRRAILALGKMPSVAYLDNGKAFKAKVFTDDGIDFEEAGFYGMFARLGIETIFAWPYNAQSKPVERFFETFSEMERLMPTFTGTSIEDKPAHMLRNERLHKALHEKRYGGWVPTIEETNKIIAGWVAEYAVRPHRGLKGLQPGEVFASGRGPGIDERALRYLMMSVEHKTVRRNGISLFGRNYYDDALYGYGNDERVLIRYDLEDLSRIYVYDVTGAKEVCEATPVKKLHPVARVSGNEEDLALVKEGIRQKRALKRSTEAAARAYIAEAPQLVERSAELEDGGAAQGALRSVPLARPLREEGRGKNQVRLLTPAEAEKIEEAASRMKVLELKPRAEPVFMSEPERYEALLERECGSLELSLDDMSFMRYFEKTALYKSLQSRYEFLRELWLSGESNGTVEETRA
jgi:putative transposase